MQTEGLSVHDKRVSAQAKNMDVRPSTGSATEMKCNNTAKKELLEIINADFHQKTSLT